MFGRRMSTLISSEREQVIEEFLRKSEEQGITIIGQTEGVREALWYAHIAAHDEEELPVLIIGATGTGKELIARAIHINSPRQEAVFWPVNCSTIPPHLAESLLFGHKRGSFTGASFDQPGHFQIASDGTLFLDEVLELPQELQPKLLRVVEYGEAIPLGANKIVYCKPRILASIMEEDGEGAGDRRLRDALMYRLAIHLIYLPPLSARKEDVPLLVEHFLSVYRSPLGFSDDATAVLEDYPWPGNIRELMYVVKRAVIQAKLQRVQKIEPKHLVFGLPGGPEGRLAPVAWNVRSSIAFLAESMLSDEEMTLDSIENRLLDAVLEACGGNKTKAGRALGITPRTIRNKLKERAEAQTAQTE